MTSKVDWKGAVGTLAALHDKDGVAVVFLNPEMVGVETDFEMVNLTPDYELYSEEGGVLNVKAVRTWLWQNWRKKRAVQRNRAILWSVTEDGKSYVGVGALTKRAERVEELQHGAV